MTCRACVQLPLDTDGIYARIDIKILKITSDLLFHLTALDNRSNPDIGTLNKERGGIFQNAVPKYSKQNSYGIKMKYDLK